MSFVKHHVYKSMLGDGDVMSSVLYNMNTVGWSLMEPPPLSGDLQAIVKISNTVLNRHNAGSFENRNCLEDISNYKLVRLLQVSRCTTGYRCN